MARTRVLVLAATVLGVLQICWSSAPPPPARGGAPLPHPAPEFSLPVGKWRIEFANGVIEFCDVRKDGTASMTEPLRNADGKATVKGGSVVIVFEDDRIERWTPVGKRLVVEHWFPGSQLPTATAVLGIAERAP